MAGADPFAKYEVKDQDPFAKYEVKPTTVQSTSGSADTPVTSPPGLGMADAAGNWLTQKGKDVYDVVTNPEKLGRLALEMGGAGVGAALGSGAAPVVGTAAGGALGFAAGRKAGDILFGERLPPDKANQIVPQLAQSGVDALTGLAYEAVPVGIGLGGRAVEGTLGLAKNVINQGPKKVAGDALKSYAERQAARKVASKASQVQELEPIIDKNIAETKVLEQEIPGLKLNLGQQTGDPNLLGLAKELSQREGPGVIKSNLSVAEQNEALRNVIKNEVRGQGNVGDFLSKVENKQATLASGTMAAKQTAEDIAGQTQGRTAQEVGKELEPKLVAERSTGAKEAERLYNAVPEETVINSTPLWNRIDKIFGSFDALTQRIADTPVGIMERVRKAMKPNQEGTSGPLSDIMETLGMDPSKILDAAGKRRLAAEAKPPTLTMKQLNDFRSQVTTLQRSAISNKDFTLAKQLEELKLGVNETLGEAARTGGEQEGVQALQAATKYWRDTYVPKFRHGGASAVLAQKKTGEKMAPSGIGGEFFKKDTAKGAAEAADQFNYIFKNDPNANGLIRDFAAQDLLRNARNPVTGELESNRVATWLYNHQNTLKKLGLDKEFGNLQGATKLADEARAAEVAFNKGSLAKALGKDSDSAIAAALTGAGGRGEAVQRLKEMADLTRHDPAALAGLRAGVADHFQRLVNITARDIQSDRLFSLAKIDKFMDTYRPALEQSGLYTTRQLKAFDNVHQAMAKISQKGIPRREGSDTFELLSRVGGTATAALMGGHWTFSPAKKLFDIINKHFVREEVDEAVARAVFDPRYAELISGLAHNYQTIPAAKLAKSFKNQFMALQGMAIEEPGEVNRMTPKKKQINHSKYER